MKLAWALTHPSLGRFALWVSLPTMRVARQRRPTASAATTLIVGVTSEVTTAPPTPLSGTAADRRGQRAKTLERLRVGDKA